MVVFYFIRWWSAQSENWIDRARARARPTPSPSRPWPVHKIWARKKAFLLIVIVSYTGRPVRVKIPARPVGRRVIILMSEGRVNMGYEPSRVERKKFRGPGRFLQARLSKSDTTYKLYKQINSY